MKIFLKYLFVGLCFYLIASFFWGFLGNEALSVLLAFSIYGTLKQIEIIPILKTNIFLKNWDFFLFAIVSLVCYFLKTVSIWWWPLGCFILALTMLIFDYRKNHGFRIIKEKE